MNSQPAGILFTLFAYSLLILLPASLDAQKRIPLSVGYYGGLAYQPGVKVGVSYPVKTWQKEKEGKKGAKTVEQSFFVSPQVGMFTLPNSHISFPINADLGYQRQKVGKKGYSAYALGLAYLMDFRTTSIIYNLSDGSVKEKIRERRGYFMPSLNVEYGQWLTPRIAWYSKASIALFMAPERENIRTAFLEIGVKFNLNPANSQN